MHGADGCFSRPSSSPDHFAPPPPNYTRNSCSPRLSLFSQDPESVTWKPQPGQCIADAVVAVLPCASTGGRMLLRVSLQVETGGREEEGMKKGARGQVGQRERQGKV